MSIEGGLLSPEWLARVAQLAADHQSEKDYRVPKGLSLRDEIGRYWRIAHAYWKEFAAGLEHHAPGPDMDRRRVLAERFISALLRDVFGFATLEATTTIVVNGHRYPISMAALNGRVPIVVAAAGEGVESTSGLFGDGGRRRSPFGLAQEYLNAAAGATLGNRRGWSHPSPPPRQRQPHTAGMDLGRFVADVLRGALRGFRRAVAARA